MTDWEELDFVMGELLDDEDAIAARRWFVNTFGQEPTAKDTKLLNGFLQRRLQLRKKRKEEAAKHLHTTLLGPHREAQEKFMLDLNSGWRSWAVELLTELNPAPLTDGVDYSDLEGHVLRRLLSECIARKVK